MKKISSVELFAGGGGLAIGLHQSGILCRGLYEWDHDSVLTLKKNVNEKTQLCLDDCIYEADVRTIDFSRFSGKVCILAGGPPCQPFSLGGKAKGNEDERDMFPEAARALNEIAPDAFIFENVAGLLRQGFRSYFDYIIRSLRYPSIARNGDRWNVHNERLIAAERTGLTPAYNVVYRLFNVVDYGVPQSRKRVIIVGFKSTLGVSWLPPEPTHSKTALLYDKWVTGAYWKKHSLPIPRCPLSKIQIAEITKRYLSSPLKPWLTIRDAIGDLPDPSTPNSVPNHEFRGGAKVYSGHSGSLLDEPSKTIKAGSHGVPGGENMIILDTGFPRYLTVRESARIQTFPDDYIFPSSWTESMRQIGNAVPCAFAKIIGLSVKTQLVGALQCLKKK